MVGDVEIEEADSLDGVAAPQFTKQIVGHQKVFDLLRTQLAQNRLPSGILIHGPKGIGKASLAYYFARYVFAETGDESSERVDEQVFAGSHPNLYVLKRALRERGTGFYNEIRVDEVRVMLRKLHQTRGRAGHRILIVDAIDDCNTNAANALLKTLEEPPADTHIILVSHRPGRLLPTLRSRCQAHSARTLSDQEVGEVLQTPETSVQDLERAISLAEGRPRSGFEAMSIGDDDVLHQLRHWLNSPKQSNSAAQIKACEYLADKKHGTELNFAREMILAWIADGTRKAAISSPSSLQYLASSNALWEKANTLFAQTDAFNLDGKASLMVLLDAIVLHEQVHGTQP